MKGMRNPFNQHRSDTWLLILVVSMVLFGVVMIYSASVIVGHNVFEDGKYFVRKQMISAVIGFIGLLVASSIDYKYWQKISGAMLIATFGLLISVFFLSKGEVNGAHRWITVLGQTFQPSELAKLTLIIYLSGWFASRLREDKLNDLTQTFGSFAVVMAGVALLMLKEPDFGTLTIMIASAIAIYFVAGINWKQILLGVLVLSVCAAGVALSSPYRRDRIMTFLNPHSNTDSTSYHVYNIGIAVGSGGAWGLGFGESKQKRGFLPEPQTDSIFAVITEELGAVRAMLVIIAYGLLASRGLKIASQSDSQFGKLMATGITVWFLFQAFINLASMLQIVPLVGVPLPFISYGGTNLVISMAAVGIILNISKYTVLTKEVNAPIKAGSRKRRR